mmetsp:Transcript_21633/g.32019  ORF Transcript_21633/g.32019 Transcript_21633/m.32019 type:complete len:245 (+) Transcript_21633:1-735(+)
MQFCRHFSAVIRGTTLFSGWIKIHHLVLLPIDTMFGGAARSLAAVARRAAAPAVRCQAPKMQQQATRSTFMRPMSVFSQHAAWTRHFASIPQAPAAQVATVAAPQTVVAEASAVAATPAKSVVDAVSKDAMVFEIGISFVFLHYQSIFIGVMRCLFQSFRPLLILFVFGQILKAVFFIAGAPIWLSFYSIWLFEVIYGLAQCAISFIFISFFYNNLSFARLRPAATQVLRQQKDKIARAAAALR